MKFGGLQKLTLLDYPGKVACTVFTCGCNFRCPFCHNASLVESKSDLSEEAVLDFLVKRRNVLEGVCLTGGEPLLQSDTENFLRKVKELGYKVKLDTNGAFPDRLQNIVQQGLVDYVAMDVKNCPSMYCATAGRQTDVRDIERSVDFLKNCGADYEFRTTVTKTFHSEQCVEELARWLCDAKRWYLQQFVHGQDLIDGTVEGYSDAELRKLCEMAQKYCPTAQTRGI